MLTNERMTALLAIAKEDGIEGDIQSVLHNAVTAGELIAVLQQFDPATPVEIEIPVEIEGKETMLSEVAYVVAAFQNPTEDQNAQVITLQGCKPDLFEAYRDFTADDENEH